MRARERERERGVVTILIVAIFCVLKRMLIYSQAIFDILKLCIFACVHSVDFVQVSVDNMAGLATVEIITANIRYHNMDTNTWHYCQHDSRNHN